ncbi:hypothetical protein [Pseudomonas sp. NPDC088444]|uniref:hypothetical protein n=1 Tax=Pseudomonas sp. NPDC088444 TaxID=3364456 RepID=UPI00384CA350
MSDGGSSYCISRSPGSNEFFLARNMSQGGRLLEIIVSQLAALIDSIQEFSRDKRDLKDNALRAISHALNETYLYYRDIEHGKPVNLDSQKQLSIYWSAAAIPLRHINEELALICEFKSEYWVNPENWSDEQIHEHGIALNDLRMKYRALVSPVRSRIHGPRSRIEPKVR